MSADPSSLAPLLELRQTAVNASPPCDLVLAGGEMVALTGWASSDLLWATAGLAASTAGQILLDGEPLKGPEHAFAAGVTLIPQGNALATLLTAFENVLLPIARRRVPRQLGAAQPRSTEGAGPGQIAGDALTAVGLAESMYHLIEELSGGQQQRVAIARALALRPRLLLADQVTTDLDPANRALVIELLRRLSRSGSAVLLASDDPAVTAGCDRTVTLPN